MDEAWLTKILGTGGNHVLIMTNYLYKTIITALLFGARWSTLEHAGSFCLFCKHGFAVPESRLRHGRWRWFTEKNMAPLRGPW